MSTNIQTGGLVSYAIKVNGAAISESIQVSSIEVIKPVNKIPSAMISIFEKSDGAGFEISSSATFVPGNSIEIEVGYDNSNKAIFKGIITNQNLKVQNEEGPLLQVECRDEAIKMLVGRKSATYAKVKDSDIMSLIIGSYSGLSSDVTSTTTKWEEQVQYYVSDWNFILSRAEVNGMVVTALNNKVSIFPPNQNTSPVSQVTYGDNLLGFNASLNSINQLGQAKGNSWDYETQKVISGEASASNNGPGNLSTKKLSEVVGLADYDLQTTAALSSSDLKNWSKAVITKSEYAKIQGEVKFQGNSEVDPGVYITLDGLGSRFDGDHFVSNVVHKLANGNWITEASIGLSPTWVTQESDVMAPSASGLLPGAQGLFNATVKKIYEDPDEQYRILIDLPLFDRKGEGVWARLANFYATSGAGAFFLPEVGDEVVVGFLNEDPRYPIILGSMYSSMKRPYEALAPNERNSKKAIVSKSKMYVEFDDEDVVLSLGTPGKNQAVFSDRYKKILIKDENGNTIELAEDGITIKSDRNINIEAQQSLTLKGNTGVNIEASSGDVQIKGMNINNRADMEFSANGGTQAKLEGGAETTIKGGMVMIN